MAEEFVGVGVGGGDGLSGDGGGRVVVLFEGGDGLGLVVVEDVKGGGGKAVDDVAGAVFHGDVREDNAGGTVEGVGGLLR